MYYFTQWTLIRRDMGKNELRKGEKKSSYRIGGERRIKNGCGSGEIEDFIRWDPMLYPKALII